MADSKVDECQCIGRVELNSFLIIFNSLRIVFILFVDISKVVVGITVPRIDLCRFYVPFYGFFFVSLCLVYNSEVVVCAVVRRL